MQAKDANKRGIAVIEDFRVTFGRMADEAPFFLADWCMLLNKTPSAVYSMENRKRLPPRIDMGQVGLAWRVATVRSWLSALPEANNSGTSRESNRTEEAPLPSLHSGKPRGRPRRPACDLTGRRFGESGAST